MVKVPEAMVVVAKLAEALGVSSINRMTHCWEYQLDQEWWLAVNGHNDRHPCTPPTHPTAASLPMVPPYGVYAERHGWPALMIDVAGGCTIGTGGEEDAFIAAVKRATESAEIGRHGPRIDPADYAICTGPADPPMEFRRIEPRQPTLDDALQLFRETWKQ